MWPVVDHAMLIAMFFNDKHTESFPDIEVANDK